MSMNVITLRAAYDTLKAENGKNYQKLSDLAEMMHPPVINKRQKWTFFGDWEKSVLPWWH